LEDDQLKKMGPIIFGRTFEKNRVKNKAAYYMIEWMMEGKADKK
jgi:hypothetical protein